MELTLAQHNLFRAVAELSYVIAQADNQFMAEEVQAFKKAIHDELGKYSWLAENRFDILQDIGDLDSAYRSVLFFIKQNRQGLTPELIDKFIRILTRVAEVAGIVDEERELLQRFEHDIRIIYQQNFQKPIA
jgi:hypothetical protein